MLMVASDYAQSEQGPSQATHQAILPENIGRVFPAGPGPWYSSNVFLESRVGAVALVGLGGALGAIARYLVGVWFVERWGTGFPYGTLLINVSGCFLIGLFLTLSAERFDLHEAWRFLVPIGFIGAYTTFSTYAYETVRLVAGGALARALLYVAVSTVVGYGAVLLGILAARRI